jgi:membrane dipeptidase
VKRSPRIDRRISVDNFAHEAEQTASYVEMNTVYKKTKQLCDKTTQPVRIKDTHDKPSDGFNTSRMSSTVLNHVNQLAEEDLYINIETPTIEETKSAIRTLHNGISPGKYSIHAEMLKTDMATSSKILQQLFNNIWNNESIPSDWTKGFIVKLTKKEDLQICDNWRGITLLSVSCKVFRKILLKRIDEKMREEQADFRKGRGCIDNMFVIRNIIEQCTESKTPLHIFQKGI